MLTFTSIKRSPPMTEAEAKLISKETDLFGYEPGLLFLPPTGDWHLMIRGDGSDDETIERRLFQLRKPNWRNPS